jgi:hypothetical protein
MGLFDDQMMHRARGLDIDVPGLIRMDRAMLYLRQRLREIIDEYERRSTKSLGEAVYRIYRFARDAQYLCRMSGDRQLLFMLRKAIEGLNQRSGRIQTISKLNELLKELESYQPDDMLVLEELRDDNRRIADQLGDDHSSNKITDRQLANQRSVFVIMPFAAEFTDVWKGGIQKAAEAEGFMPIRVDMINRSTNITDDIVSSIDKCHLAIVDVTNNNPNVMFELGYAIAKNKKNIIISQSADFLPFDIRNIRTIVYANSWSGVEELKLRIQEFLKESAPPKHTKRSAKRAT